MNNGMVSDDFLRSASAKGVDLSTQALCAPDHLANRLIYGENLLQIWIDHEQIGDDELVSLWKISKAELHAMARDPYEAYRQLTGQQVLSFAKRIGVHPAHLSPASIDPAYSLPFSIFMANHIMAHDFSETFENISLAKQALERETKRYDAFMKGKYMLKDMSFSHVADHLKAAIASGARDRVLRQLDTHCDDPQKYNLLAPMMMDALLDDKYRIYSRLTAREHILSDNLEKAEGFLDMCYQSLFGPVASDKHADITRYALNRLWGAMRPRQGKDIVEVMARKITADVAKRMPVTALENSMTCSLRDVFQEEIENLARVSILYINEQCKYDNFYAQNYLAMSDVSDKIEPLEYARRWMMSDVGGYIRRLFANQAVLNPAPPARDILRLPVRAVQKDSDDLQMIAP